MALVDNIPTMADTALGTLLNNAKRLETLGTAAQQTAAARIIPLVTEELDRRRDAKKAQIAQNRADARAARKGRTVKSADLV